MKVRFGRFTLDSGARALLDDGGAVHLSPKAFDIFEILLARRPNVVSKEVLLGEVWPGKIVEEANLAIAIGEIRKALGEDSRAPTLVLTVPRRGYRFAAPVQDLDAGGSASGTEAATFARWWLVWGDKTLPLREGENLVGRHPASGVWLSGASVSRTHARITIAPPRLTIEDCGSRNGTFVDGAKVSAAHPLADGSRVTFGSEVTTFRQWSDEGAAGTEPVRIKER